MASCFVPVVKAESLPYDRPNILRVLQTKRSTPQHRKEKKAKRSQARQAKPSTHTPQHAMKVSDHGRMQSENVGERKKSRKAERRRRQQLSGAPQCIQAWTGRAQCDKQVLSRNIAQRYKNTDLDFLEEGEQVQELLVLRVVEPALDGYAVVDLVSEGVGRVVYQHHALHIPIGV